MQPQKKIGGGVILAAVIAKSGRRNL